MEGLKALTPEGYVAAFDAHGRVNHAPPLDPWEREYQDAGIIEEARRLGYIWIDGGVSCDVTVTAHGETVIKLVRAEQALADALERLTDPQRQSSGEGE